MVQGKTVKDRAHVFILDSVLTVLALRNKLSGPRSSPKNALHYPDGHASASVSAILRLLA